VPEIARLSTRFVSGLEFAVCHHCGSDKSGSRFVYAFPLLSVTLVTLMTELSLMTKATRLPVVGNCSFHVPFAGGMWS